MVSRYLTSEDLNPSPRYRHTPGDVVLRHLSGKKEEYVLICWHKKEGDRIGAFEVIATVETASLTAEIEAYDSGIVEHLRFKVGEAIPDGAIIATIRTNKI